MHKYIVQPDLDLHIPDDILGVFYEHRQNDINRLESGGILLGSCYNSYILIRDLSVPGVGDIQSTDSFIRNKKRAQTIINQTFDDNNGTIVYLGEWHTHNESIPSSSSIDKHQLKLAFDRSKLHFNFMIVIIVGNQDHYGNLWVGKQDKTGLSTCPIPICFD